jgi:hypothetical protein
MPFKNPKSYSNLKTDAQQIVICATPDDGTQLSKHVAESSIPVLISLTAAITQANFATASQST